jgi:hypothetical protein
LRVRPFKTVRQLREYLFSIYGKDYTRSVVARHLVSLSYDNKANKIELTDSVDSVGNDDCRRIRKAYCDMIGPFLESAYHTVLFVDELTLRADMFRSQTANADEGWLDDGIRGYVKVMVGATWDGLLCYDIKHG